MSERTPMTVPLFVDAKGQRKLTVLTAYDYPMAKLFDDAGVDALLVGDTLGHVIQGHADTLTVTVEQMIYHTEMVARAAPNALVIADMPFLSYQTAPADAVRNAGRLLKEGRAQCVKLEGGRRVLAAVEAIVAADIPVMGHLGLTPQSIHKLGRYHVQRDEEKLLDDALALQEAGCFSLVLEAVPAKLAKKITGKLAIPTIGIGAGADCDGQVLVWHDALGLTNPGFKPRFVKRYADLYGVIRQAVTQYCDEVRAGQFPDAEHSYK